MGLYENVSDTLTTGDYGFYDSANENTTNAVIINYARAQTTGTAYSYTCLPGLPNC